jgi:UPF0755 protein
VSTVSDLGLDLKHEHERERTHRKKPRRRRSFGCLAVLIALAVLVGGGYAVFTFGKSALQERFGPPPDYPGPGTGSVMVEVEEGDAASDIADTLVAKDVVKSREAFTDAAVENPESRGIQVGFYELKHKMPAAAALEVLVDPENLIQSAVTIPEGWTVDQIVAELARETDFSRKEFRRELDRPGKLGLPEYAGGEVEGYLFPATYQIRPNATPRSILQRMVDRFEESADELGLKAGAADLGVSPHDVVVVASLIQAEARFDKDFAKVSRVIYNRLAKDMPLQFDSTVHYAVGKDGSVGTSDSDRNVDSPYNTYEVTGLPPTPIDSPGAKALRAALEPAAGDWLYFVTTNPDTGETKFAESYREHLRNKAEFDQWCAESDHC